MQLDALAFGAHVDDIELGCAGTLIKLTSKGYKIGACDLTEGELSTRGTVETRMQEAGKAAEIMGLSTRINLAIPDGNIENTLENRLKIIRVVREHRPRYIFVNYWKCRHFDHVHASTLVSEACFYSGLRKIDTGQEAFRPAIIFYYFLRHEFEPSFIVDVSDQFQRKMDSIMAHKSQFYDPESQEPDTFISSKYFIDSIANRMKYFGLRIGVEYGEPLLVRESMRIDDPIEVFDKMDATRIMSTRNSC